MNQQCLLTLTDLGIPSEAIIRLQHDDDAILAIGDISISVVGDEVLCLDHDLPDIDTEMDADCILYFRERIKIALAANDDWYFLADEPQLGTIMSFGIDEGDDDEIMA